MVGEDPRPALGLEGPPSISSDLLTYRESRVLATEEERPGLEARSLAGDHPSRPPFTYQ